MVYNLDFINETAPTIIGTDDDRQAFESDYELTGFHKDDMGGLIVYTDAGTVRAVYDYENMCGWVL